ncbi:histidine phosphatase family protein [Poseidonibacter lekithochrous]|uniref:SixA phosphatase family protein n=1 Tax=Poseidonibacter TaxID=2321187 RepID=UPI001C080E3D|nr:MULTISPECIES: histidine phosphatase family protein [Poseidonibacter]MBU3015705.1 histidine phosphatase family protein [Poseidonibacter lekithochrous]MDO6829005.1 histidine phosphatase family protein [Poseidonibacter sp. 1_MG-2023]
MKKLYIVRHTHKAQVKSGQDDYDRELSQEGLDEAKQIAQKLSSKSIKTDLIVSSPAVRTRQTAEVFADILNYDKSIMYNEVLYLAFVNELIETISYTFDTVDTMILIGHNPSLTALAITLIDFKEKFEVGGVMEIEFDCNSWIDIGKENAKLVSYILPDK